MKRNTKLIFLLALAFAACFIMCACSGGSSEATPEQWGYECQVTYDALGGIINARDVRYTYYMPDSYLYEPSGSANMLVEPAKEGCVLAGWYTAKEDVLDDAGNVIGYSFKAEDRWDFQNDRVTGDITLYANWITSGVADYIDVQSGEVVFTKKISTDSHVQPLSSAVLIMITPLDGEFDGYFCDENCTAPFDFSVFSHHELFYSDDELISILHSEFPDTTQLLDSNEIGEYMQHENEPEFLLLLKNGGGIISKDAETFNLLKQRRNELIEERIDAYAVSTASQKIYLKFTQG